MVHVKGPNWKKLWRHQKHFLLHKSQQRDVLLFCGRTIADWVKIILFAGTFYGTLLGFWFLCWYLFNSLIIMKTGNTPYRTGYIFANEKIPKEMASLQKLADEVAKKKPMKGSFGSPLDFPMLTTLPRHYEEEDTDDGITRTSEYQIQIDQFWGKLWSIEEKLKKNKKHNVKNCTAENFAAARIKDGILKTVCKAQAYTDIEANCYQNGTWGWRIGKSINDFSPCLLLKLNKITGFIPAPMSGKRLMKAWKDAASNGTSMYIFPSKATLEKQKDKYGTPNYPWLPVTCWFGLARGGKPIQEGLAPYFGKDFATFYPSAEESDGRLGHIDLRSFPFMNQKNYVHSVLAIKLKFNDKIKPNDIITMECRIMAVNVPYVYRLELSPQHKFGHLRLRMKYYLDENLGGNYFFKLEK